MKYVIHNLTLFSWPERKLTIFLICVIIFKDTIPTLSLEKRQMFSRFQHGDLGANVSPVFSTFHNDFKKLW
jgi:hypothetical protein